MYNCALYQGSETLRPVFFALCSHVFPEKRMNQRSHFVSPECRLQDFHDLIVGQNARIDEELFKHPAACAKPVCPFLPCQLFLGCFEVLLPVCGCAELCLNVRFFFFKRRTCLLATSVHISKRCGSQQLRAGVTPTSCVLEPWTRSTHTF